MSEECIMEHGRKVLAIPEQDPSAKRLQVLMASSSSVGKEGTEGDTTTQGSDSPVYAVCPPEKKQRTQSPGAQVPRCQVEECKQDLSGCKEYHKRHKVCEAHCKAARVVVGGLNQRFCQLCSRFHGLHEFDDGKRSCRKRLAGHAERRRKPPPKAPSIPSSGSSSPFFQSKPSERASEDSNDSEDSEELSDTQDSELPEHEDENEDNNTGATEAKVDEGESDVTGNDSVSTPALNATLKFRAHVKRLGLTSWDEDWDPGRTLVMADVTGIGDAGGPQRSWETDSVRLSSDEAVSKFGIRVAGLQGHNFTNLSLNSPGSQGPMQCQPRWRKWVKGLMKLMSIPLEYLDQSQQGAEASVNGVNGEKQGKGQLVVIVSFRAPDSPFYMSGDGRRLEKVEIDNIRPTPTSSIVPKLCVEFYRDAEGNHLTTNLWAEYQMGCKKGVCAHGWYQDDLRLSFEWSDDGDQQCALHDSQIISPTEFVETESTTQSGISKSAQQEGNYLASFQASFPGSFLSSLSANAQASGKLGTTNLCNESDQTKYKLKKKILTEFSSFGITKHNMSDSKMEYQASYLGRTADTRGLQENVDLEVEGMWDLYGDGIHKYDFKASKSIFTRKPTAKASSTSSGRSRIPLSDAAGSRFWNRWVGDESVSCISNIEDAPGARQDEEEILWQEFKRTFVLNHNLSQFLETHKRPYPYRWKLLTPGNQGNECPVPDALGVTD